MTLPPLFTRSIAAVLFVLLAQTAVHAERVKDIASVAGVRANQLVGYGIVVGLAGTGDGNSGLHLRKWAKRSISPYPQWAAPILCAAAPY